MVIRIVRPRASLLSIRDVDNTTGYEVINVYTFIEGGRRETGYLINDNKNRPITVYENEIERI